MLACTAPDEEPAGFEWIKPTWDEDSERDSTVDSTPVDSDPIDSDPPPEPLPLCINEFMADNRSALIGEAGETPDWIELHNPTDEAIDLAGWRLADAIDEELPWVLSGLALEPGGYLLLYADGVPETGNDHLDFKLDADGGSVALWAPDGRGQVIHYGHVEPDFSVSRIQDCCSGEGCLDFAFRGTPGRTNNTLEDLPVIGKQALWRWFDQGEPPSDWATVDFDDDDWDKGYGDFGFGEPERTSTVASGAEDDRTPTIYFRKTVELPEVQGGSIELNVDDGAIVRLNGVEALRVNLPEGEVGHLTWALEAVGGSDESVFTAYDLPDEDWVEGDNVIAVEVHQAAATSSDLGFDLAMTAHVWRMP